MLCFRKFPVAKISMDKRRGYQDFPSKVSEPQPRKIWRGNLFVLCFRKPPYRKRLCITGEGIKIFHRNFFCLEVLKEVVMEHFCAVFPKFSGSKKLYGYKSGCPDFPSKIFCLTMPKSLAREPFCAVFQKTSGIENVYA